MAAAVRETLRAGLEDPAWAQLESQHYVPSPAGSGGAAMCNTTKWPDVNHSLTCGPCKVLVEEFYSYLTCEGYCSAVGRQCRGAWKREHTNCSVAVPLDCDTAYSSFSAICKCSDEEVIGKRESRVVAIESLGADHSYVKTWSGEAGTTVYVMKSSTFPPGNQSLFSLSEVSEDAVTITTVLSERGNYLHLGLTNLSRRDKQLRLVGASLSASAAEGGGGSDTATGAGTAAAPRFKLHRLQQESPSGLEVVRFESLGLPGHFVGTLEARYEQQTYRDLNLVNISQEDMNKSRLFDFRLHPQTEMMSRAWKFDDIDGKVYNVSKGPGGHLLRFEESLYNGDSLVGLLHPAGVADFEGNLSTDDGAKMMEVRLSPVRMSGQVVAGFRQLGPGEAPAAWEEVTLTVKPRRWQCSEDSSCTQNLLWGFIAFSVICGGTLLFWWSHAASALCSTLVMFLWFICADNVLLVTARDFWVDTRWRWGRGGGSVPLSPIYWVDAVLLFFVLVGCLEVLILSLVTKISGNSNGQSGGMSAGAAGEDERETSGGSEAGEEVSCESIYSNISVRMTRSCLVFVAQGVLFGMYVHSVIVNASNMRVQTDEAEASEVKMEANLAVYACLIVQVSLEKLLGRNFGLQFTNVWSRLLRAKSFRGGTSQSTAGGSGQGLWGRFWKRLAEASGCSRLLGLDRQVAGSADAVATTASSPASPSSSATPGFDPGNSAEAISKMEVCLRMCMAFAAHSVMRRFILYTLPIMVVVTARDPTDFVKDILAYAYITSLDMATNEELIITLDPPAGGPSSAPAPPPTALDSSAAHGQDAEAHTGGASPARPTDEASG